MYRVNGAELTITGETNSLDSTVISGLQPEPAGAKVIVKGNQYV